MHVLIINKRCNKVKYGRSFHIKYICALQRDRIVELINNLFKSKYVCMYVHVDSQLDNLEACKFFKLVNTYVHVFVYFQYITYLYETQIKYIAR